MFLINQELMYWVMFLFLEIIALFPIFIYILSKKDLEIDKQKRLLKWGIRAIICDIICLVLFIFIPSFRLKTTILLVLLIVINGFLFKKNIWII